MVLRATFVVLCIVLSLALFSNSSEQENGWIWAAAVGAVVAGIVLGIEYTLRQGKAGVVVGGPAGLPCCPPRVRMGAGVACGNGQGFAICLCRRSSRSHDIYHSLC